MLNLNDIEITTINPYGLYPLELKGEFDKESLANKLVERWIPYYECHKCGRADYCKFTIPHKYVDNKFQDIQCGVVVKVLRNFIDQTFNLLDKYNKEQLQKYFDGLYYFQKFIYQTELETGMFLDKGMLDWYREFSPSNYGHILYIRHYLDKLGENFMELSEFGATKGMLLVEGETEKVLINRLISNGDFSDKQFIIQSYEGKKNKSEKKIKILIERSREIGYDIYIQGDKDGENINFFQNHINNNLIEENHTFQFSYDFETSIPKILLYDILNTLKIIDCDSEEFIHKVADKKQSINKTIFEEFEIDLNKYKVDIADKLGIIIRHLQWRTNESIHNSELGEFLEFVYRI
jgi:hypothetical protein